MANDKQTAADKNPLAALGIEGNSESLTYESWKPWEDGTQPKFFRGIYEGYRVLKGDQGPYPAYCFIDCMVGPDKPAPKSSYLVASGMISDLARVTPGQEVALIWTGDKKNKHKGMSHGIDVHIVGKGARKKAVMSRAMLPMNIATENPALMLPSHDPDASGDASEDVKF